MMKRIALSFFFASTLASVVPSRAQAQHKSPLADAPAIRKRVELRDKRFEVAVGAGSTLNETFYHGVLLNGRLAFHITDWLAISGLGLFNVKSLATGFQDELTSTLNDPEPGDRAPTAAIAKSAMNKPSMVLAGQLEFTPFTGKFSLFGKLFAHYDFYIAGGPAFVTLVKASSGTAAAACKEKTSDSPVFCTVTGSKIGGTVAGGFHAFINDFVGIGGEIRTVGNKDNPAGRDVNGDGHADNGDLTWTLHWVATLGVTVFLPPKADISN